MGKDDPDTVLADAAEGLYEVLADVRGKQSSTWRKTALRARDEYFKALTLWLQAKTRDQQCKR